MDDAALKQEGMELVRTVDNARLAIERNDWGSAERLLTEAQGVIGRLLREVGDKQHEAMMAPPSHQVDRG